MLEQLELKHIQTITRLKTDFTEQIEDLQEVISQMAASISRLTSENSLDRKEFYEATLDKDIHIQELEEQNDELEEKVSELTRLKLPYVSLEEINEMRTMINAMKINLKNSQSRISELEASNKELTLKSRCFIPIASDLCLCSLTTQSE